VEDRREGEEAAGAADGQETPPPPHDQASQESQESQESRPAVRERPSGNGGSSGGESRADRSIPLRKLVELAARYAEVGPPLAELCFAIGESEIGEQLVRLGTQGGAQGVEYWFVAANAARRQRRYPDALRATKEALQAFAAAPDQSLGAEGESRFLHLMRLGFATLMFDLRDLNADPEFSRALAENLPKLENRLGASPFFRSLVAQTLWFSDKEASEREWDRAGEMGDPETTWNARGTWYHEAEQDLEKAERAYRHGLEQVPASALLMHNLAQILVEKARRPGVSTEEARRRLNQATELLRTALRQDAPRLRRHIHATRDRLEELRRTLPPLPPRSDRDRDRGPRDRGGPPRDRMAGGGGDRPAAGGGGGGVGGGGGGHQDRDRDRDRGDRGPRRPRESQPVQPKQNFLVKGTVSLGEMILAKLKEQEKG
jgi:tetratricopeptide (TPR) repeat protein